MILDRVAWALFASVLAFSGVCLARATPPPCSSVFFLVAWLSAAVVLVKLVEIAVLLFGRRGG